MTKKELALDYFTQRGCNCAQSLLLAFCEDYGVDKNAAAKIAASFGGGIGRQGETCGALTGALMALGLKSQKDFLNDKDAKAEMVLITQEFINKFRIAFGAVKCRDLLGCDVGSEAGQLYIKEHNLNLLVCQKVVGETTEMLELIK